MRFSRLRLELRRLRSSFGALQQGRLALFLIFIGCLIISLAVISNRMQPIVEEMAVAEVTDVVKEYVGIAIGNVISENRVEYRNLVDLEKDSNGRITALVTDMQEINSLQSEIANETLNILSTREDTFVSVPLGNVFGSTIFSGWGPKIPIKIVAVTSVNTDFSNKFSSAGINQTRHQIMMNVHVSITFFMSGGSTDAEVVTEMCVAETVIVGDVPENYAEIG